MTVLRLIIEDDDGRKTVVPLARDEITIGRQEGNTIRLTERNVSRRHARLVKKNDDIFVEDLGSYNGVRVNGEIIKKQAPARLGDIIVIGDYELSLSNEAELVAEPTVITDPQFSTEAVRTNQIDLNDSRMTVPLPSNLVTVESTVTSNPSVPVVAPDAATALEPTAIEFAPEAAPRMVLMNTADAGKSFPILQTTITIGRGEGNDVSIDHRSLSRVHARVERLSNTEWRVFDHDSSNGVRVNGEKFTEAPLQHSDVVQLGHVKLMFCDAGLATPAFEPEIELPKSNHVFKILIALLFAGGIAVVAYYLETQKSEDSEQPPAQVTVPVEKAPIQEPKTQPTQEEKGRKFFERGLEQYAVAKQTKALALKMKDSAAQATTQVARSKLETSAQEKNVEANQQYVVAQASFQQAADAAPQNSEFQKYLGLSLLFQYPLNQDALMKARAHFQSAANTSPDDPEILLNLGVTFYREKDFESAKKWLQRCLAVESKQSKCHMYMAFSLTEQRPADTSLALNHCSKYLQYAAGDDVDLPRVRKFCAALQAAVHGK